MHVLVWKGVDAPRMEIAYAEHEAGRLRARGTQIGVAYELRYELEPARLRAEIVGGSTLDLELGEHDFFDLEHSPLFNSLPVLRDGLVEARDYVMAWVSVPELSVSRSTQRYEPLGGRGVRYRSDSFVADLELDADGFVLRYPGLAERVS